MRKTFYLFLILFLTSCYKEEIPVRYTGNSNAISANVEMGPSYENQIFYSFESSTVVSSNSRFNHDFRLVKTESFTGIRLNSAKYMRAYPLTGNFSDVFTVDESEFEVDRVGEFLDSTVIDLDQHSLYMVDFGKNEDGSSLGNYKVEFELSSSGILIKCAQPANTSSFDELEVDFNDVSKIQDFSLLDLTLVNNVPEINSWDIKFTQYTDILEGHTPYLVTGVLINSLSVKALKVKGFKYDDFTLETLENTNFETRRDEIGYTWKEYDFPSSSYLIEEDNAYLLKCADGVYRYLKFTGFYNEFGEKGYPSFEIKEY